MIYTSRLVPDLRKEYYIVIHTKQASLDHYTLPSQNRTKQLTFNIPVFVLSVFVRRVFMHTVLFLLLLSGCYVSFEFHLRLYRVYDDYDSAGLSINISKSSNM